MKDDKIAFSVQMTPKEIFRFMCYHVYSKLSGIFGVLLSMVACIILVVSFPELTDQSRTILILIAIWFLILYPVMLYTRSSGQVKRNPIYQKPLHYVIERSGITISQEENEQMVSWEQITTVVETKYQYLFYSSRIHAFIFPKEMIGVESDVFNQKVCGYIEDKQIRLKGAIKKFWKR